MEISFLRRGVIERTRKSRIAGLLPAMQIQKLRGSVGIALIPLECPTLAFRRGSLSGQQRGRAREFRPLSFQVLLSYHNTGTQERVWQDSKCIHHHMQGTGASYLPLVHCVLTIPLGDGDFSALKTPQERFV